MASKKSIDRALVANLIKRLAIEIEKPTLAAVPGSHDVEAEIRSIDAFVDRLMTMATTSSKTKHASPPAEYTSGSKAVQLRIPQWVINAFRAASLDKGVGYQTLMIRALTEAADGGAL